MFKTIKHLGAVLVLFLAILTLAPLSRSTPSIAEAESSIPVQEMTIQAKTLDPRAVVLRDYFAKFDSPLQNYAQDFVDAADTYGVDWKLVPSIAGVESTFGKETPGSDYYPSYNGWGWGVYGNQAIYFKSWKDGIYTVTAGIGQNYTSKGITSPYIMNYTYAASPAWGGHVAYFMSDLDQFSKAYNLQPVVALAPVTSDKKVVAASAQLIISQPVKRSNNLTFALNP